MTVLPEPDDGAAITRPSANRILPQVVLVPVEKSRQATTRPATTIAGVGGASAARKAPTSPSVVTATRWPGSVALEMKVKGSVGSRPPAIRAAAISGACFTAMYMTMTGEAVRQRLPSRHRPACVRVDHGR